MIELAKVLRSHFAGCCMGDLQWRIWQHYSKKKKESMVKGPEYYKITEDCIFEDSQRVGSFFLLRRWRFAFIGYFSAGNGTKITTALNQRIWQTLWTSSHRLSQRHRSRPAQWKWSTKSRRFGKRQALWSDEPSFIPLTSYIGNRWGKSHCISQPRRSPDGKKTSFVVFRNLFF